jgi:hypothetical protein
MFRLSLFWRKTNARSAASSPRVMSTLLMSMSAIGTSAFDPKRTWEFRILPARRSFPHFADHKSLL